MLSPLSMHCVCQEQIIRSSTQSARPLCLDGGGVSAVPLPTFVQYHPSIHPPTYATAACSSPLPVQPTIHPSISSAPYSVLEITPGFRFFDFISTIFLLYSSRQPPLLLRPVYCRAAAAAA